MAIQNPFRGWSLASFLGVIVGAVVLIQILAYLVSLVYPQAASVRLGWVFTLLLAAAAAIIPLMIVIKKEFKVDKQDIFAILIVGAFTIFLIWFLPQVIPQVFSTLRLNQFNPSTFSIFG